MKAVGDHLPLNAMNRHIIDEKRTYSKAEKENLVNCLRKAKNYLLMGVQGGSLSEGVDYNNNILSCIIIAGMPFPPPSLELDALQEYYLLKFGQGKGYEYACVYPALNRVLQAVGRCIRSETDRGFVVLMDKRFNYPQYKNAIPQEFTYTRAKNLSLECKKFFQMSRLS
jgi:DNA excision repair protein ERCC-2